MSLVSCCTDSREHVCHVRRQIRPPACIGPQELLCAPYTTPAVGGRRFRYLFYVDFEGNLADDLPQNAMRHLREVSEFMRVLGCYPMHADAPASS